MEDLPGYIAPVATTIAAMMTAANISARVTGWGFVVFTVGSVCWSLIGITTDQTNLLWSNAFLTVVNLVGIWRWLGRQAKYADGSARAMERSEGKPGPTLASAGGLMNAAITDRAGNKLAVVVDAMLSREDHRLVYLVASRGGVGGLGEQLHPLDPQGIEIGPDGVTTRLSAIEFDRLPVLQADRWPADLPAAARMRR
jgi:hypothetical protein